MIGSSRKVIVGGAELNFKRDRMEIQPLLSEPGISKLFCLNKLQSTSTIWKIF
jgi:hypothetical protein